MQVRGRDETLRYAPLLRRADDRDDADNVGVHDLRAALAPDCRTGLDLLNPAKLRRAGYRPRIVVQGTSEGPEHWDRRLLRTQQAGKPPPRLRAHREIRVASRRGLALGRGRASRVARLNWVKSDPRALSRTVPISFRKRPSFRRRHRSQMCHDRTHAPQQKKSLRSLSPEPGGDRLNCIGRDVPGEKLALKETRRVGSISPRCAGRT